MRTTSGDRAMHLLLLALAFTPSVLSSSIDSHSHSQADLHRRHHARRASSSSSTLETRAGFLDWLGDLGKGFGQSNPLGNLFGSKDVITPKSKVFKLVPAQSHSGSNFFNGFTFWTLPDPTLGLVKYVDSQTAFKKKLAGVYKGKAYIKVDDKTNLKKGQLRNSVRLGSNVDWKKGQMVIIDVESMPYGAAVWPAFWASGPLWPWGGEVDIIEGVHDRNYNQVMLHSSDKNCTLSPKNVLQSLKMTGKVVNKNCYADPEVNQGCGVHDRDKNSYGKNLNKAGGGVFASLWDDNGITVWRFSRKKIPSDIKSRKPRPFSWPAPVAHFSNAHCDMDKYFPASMQLILDTTLCGTWAGSASSWAGTGKKGTCADYVKTGKNFKNAAWMINYINTYQ